MNAHNHIWSHPTLAPSDDVHKKKGIESLSRLKNTMSVYWLEISRMQKLLNLGGAAPSPFQYHRARHGLKPKRAAGFR
jgi:hypothetical protein